METVIDHRTAAGLEKHFAALSKHVPLRPIRSKHDYAAAVAALNALVDAGAAQERHPLADLVATLLGPLRHIPRFPPRGLSDVCPLIKSAPSLTLR